MRPGTHKRVRGIDQLDKIISVDQSPIGRTPRSNPATYIELFDQIRDLFSKTQEGAVRATSRGASRSTSRWPLPRSAATATARSRSRCTSCPTSTCHASSATASATTARRSTYFKGKTIADVLDMPIEEALEFFAHIPKDQAPGAGAARRRAGLHAAQAARDGLCPAARRSGSSSAERATVATGKTLYILDEPTTGLHFADIQRLLEVLQRLVDQGNSVVVIEHNLDVIKTADRIIGWARGGDDGGELVGRHAEEVAAVEGSYTGRFLAGIVGPGLRARRAPRRQKVAAAA